MPSLGAVRGLAIAIVLAAQSNLVFGMEKAGAVGVTIFFVLSGYSN